MRYLFFFVSSILSRWINRGAEPSPDEIKRILVIKLDHIGDVVTALPAIISLRNRFPNSEITVLAGSWSKEILDNHSAINEVIFYNAPRYVRRNEDKQTYARRRRILKTLEKRQFELIVGLQETWATLFSVCAMKPVMRFDRGTYRMGMKLKSIPPEKRVNSYEIPYQHEVVTNLGIVKSYQAARDFSWPLLECTQKEREKATDILLNIGFEGSPVVVIHPGATWKYRRWPAERFAELGNKIFEELDLPIIFGGSKDEVTWVESIRSMMKNRSFSLAGKLSLREYISILERTQVLIANDGGAVHLASALGIPVIALMGPADPLVFGPWGPGADIAFKRAKCCPCNQVSCIRPLEPCINDITVDEVYLKVKSRLKKES